MKNRNDTIWSTLGMTRRQFLIHFGIASSALTLSPFFFERLSSALAYNPLVRVFLVKNGDCFQNTAKLWEMLGGPSKYIDPQDIVIIKGNGQWPKQGYTHTGCIKGVIDSILEIPGFSGEIFICDNIQECGGPWGFTATGNNTYHNWPDYNWTTLASEYQAMGKSVAAKQWLNADADISGPEDGEGWIRDFFQHEGLDTYLSYPIFESSLSPGHMIDMKNGIWYNGEYTSAQVKIIFMPGLNNHGNGGEDYAGVTSAIKSFFGATEIHSCSGGLFRGYADIHRSTYSRRHADYAGQLTARFIKTMYAPNLYITAAMWSGHYSRTGNATETKTVLACENPATLDYVASRDVISPYAPWLDPDQDSNTRKQIMGCISSGVGTIDPLQFEIIAYDFDNPTVNRLDIDRKIKQHKDGSIPEQEVKDVINEYLETF